jgi:hypothetical protein
MSPAWRALIGWFRLSQDCSRHRFPQLGGVTTASWIFGAGGLGSFIVAVALLREIRRKQRALSRLIVTTGTVRELGTTTHYNNTGGRRGITAVRVDFAVGGQMFRCQQLYLFAGNSHVGEVGQKFDFPPGQEVGVHYDPTDPRVNALIVDQPRFHSVVIAAITGIVFMVLAIVQAR